MAKDKKQSITTAVEEISLLHRHPDLSRSEPG